jgi:Brp/Blh family beta-carotene 15,15'-monooxygenase
MRGMTGISGHAGPRFREVAFRRLPLAVMASAGLAGALGGSQWSAALGPLPWVVALGCVGLPHGAADFAVSHRVWRGWPLAIVWLAYTAVMAAVLAGFAVAPVPTIVAFAAVSCWHFGAAHFDTAIASCSDGRVSRSAQRIDAALARGCLVLAVPLAAWPVATAAVAADLAAVSVGRGPAADLFPPAAVRAAGFVLAAVSMAAAAAEGLVAMRRPRSRRSWLQGLGELAVIASLGWCTDPLFSVGLSFLVWHGWRQMGPLAVSLTGGAPRSWAALGRAVVRIHRAALPLLVPAWVAIGAVWWLWSPDHTPRALAIVSIAAYLVVTPAHELLGGLLRQMAGQPMHGMFGGFGAPGDHADDGRGRSISRPAMYLCKMLEMKV